MSLRWLISFGLALGLAVTPVLSAQDEATPEGGAAVSTPAESEAPAGTWWGMPEQASTLAPTVDRVYDVINWILAFFFVIIVVALVWLCVKYRRRSHVADTGGPTHNTPLEVTWTVIPMILVIAIFYVGLKGYVHIITPPENSYVIDVTGQRWVWTFQYPNGATDNSTLHIPVNTPIKLNMRSDDVLHAVFIPAFRVKQDVVPGRRTELWFEATHVGEYHLFCAEYCGTDHSQMRAKVKVYPEAQFQVVIDELARWIDEVPDESLHKAGALLYNQCASCHTLDGTKLIGPSFKETFDLYKAGGTRAIRGGSVRVDEAYLRNSIMAPLDQIAMDGSKPYPSSMPPGIGKLLGDRKVDALVRFIMQLDEVAPDGQLIEVKRSDIVVRPEGGGQ